MGGLSPKEKVQLKEANVLVERTFDALSLLWDHKGTWGLENPVHGSSRPELWQMPLMRQLSQLSRVTEVDFDQCRFGLGTRKPTKIMFSSHAAGFNELRGRKCDHPKGSHESTAGKRTRDASGEHWASRAQGEYPPHLCQVVAHSLFQAFASEPWRLRICETKLTRAWNSRPLRPRGPGRKGRSRTARPLAG